MRASTDRTAGCGPGVRASDAERDQIVDELRDRFAEGRLTQDTFIRRVDAALQARDQAELRMLVADLPRRRPRRGLTAAIEDLRCSAQAVLSGWLRSAPQPLVLPAGSQRRFTIGREEACDLTIYDLTVSRWHAGLQQCADGWLLADLGSTNGTRLNGWRVSGQVPVRPGDWISFGGVTVVLAERPAARRMVFSGS